MRAVGGAEIFGAACVVRCHCAGFVMHVLRTHAIAPQVHEHDNCKKCQQSAQSDSNANLGRFWQPWSVGIFKHPFTRHTPAVSASPQSQLKPENFETVCCASCSQAMHAAEPLLCLRIKACTLQSPAAHYSVAHHLLLIRTRLCRRRRRQQRLMTSCIQHPHRARAEAHPEACQQRDARRVEVC